jgi:4-amino-4-deoxy-L-arabinose transferase-like glycosyltransferase
LTAIFSSAWLYQYRFVLVVIVVGLLIRIPLVVKPFNDGGYDAWREADTASIAHNFYEGGLNILYPQINWGGNGPGYVETEFQLYTFLVAILYQLFGEQVWLGRLLSLVLAIPTFVVFYALARRVVSAQAAFWALFFFVFSPLNIRYGAAFMPESMVLLFYVTSLFLFQKWLDEQRTPVLLGAGISTAVAILVKPTAIHIGLVFLLLLFVRYRFAVIKQWRLWTFALIALLPNVVYFAHARNLYLTYGNTFGLFSGGDSKFGNLSTWLSPGFYWDLAKLDVKWIFAIAGALLFVVGLAAFWRKRPPFLIIFGGITIMIYYMIVARYAREEWGVQYHIYLLPYAALGVGLGLAWLFRQWESGGFRLSGLARSPYTLAGIFCIAFVLFSSATTYRQVLAAMDPQLTECSEQVAALVPEESLIIASTTSGADDNGVPNNYQEPQIFFYSHRNGWSLAADRHTPEQVERFVRDGAAYLVIYSDSLYSDNPAFADYLEQNARQIGPGVDAGCGIYQFTPQT